LSDGACGGLNGKDLDRSKRRGASLFDWLRARSEVVRRRRYTKG